MAWGAQQPKARNAGSHRRSRLLQRASLPAARRLRASAPRQLRTSGRAPRSSSARPTSAARLAAPRTARSLHTSARQSLLGPAPRPPPAHLAPLGRLPPSHPERRLLAAGTAALRRHPRAGGGGAPPTPEPPRGGPPSSLRRAEETPVRAAAPRRAAPAPHRPRPPSSPRACTAEGLALGSQRAVRRGQPRPGAARVRGGWAELSLPLAVRRASFACYGTITARRSRQPPRRWGGPGSPPSSGLSVALRWSRPRGERWAAAPRRLLQLYLSLLQLCFQHRGCA